VGGRAEWGDEGNPTSSNAGKAHFCRAILRTASGKPQPHSGPKLCLNVASINTPHHQHWGYHLLFPHGFPSKLTRPRCMHHRNPRCQTLHRSSPPWFRHGDFFEADAPSLFLHHRTGGVEVSARHSAEKSCDWRHPTGSCLYLLFDLSTNVRYNFPRLDADLRGERHLLLSWAKAGKSHVQCGNMC